MFTIRQIHDDVLHANRQVLEQVQTIFRSHFPSVADYADRIPDMLRNPFEFGYRSILLISESRGGAVSGFSLFLHFPEINSSLLDFIAVRRGTRGGGVGGALYEATRRYLMELKSRGLFMEVLPDDPQVIQDPALLKENRKRLKFYEHYGVFPIIGTDYETPVGDDPVAPMLLFDGLGRKNSLKRSEARAAVRLILRRKYYDLVGQDYIERVVESFIDDPVRFRDARYLTPNHEAPVLLPVSLQKSIAMVYSDNHRIHHLHERGYVERPARVDTLVDAVSRMKIADTVPVRHFGGDVLRTVHDTNFVSYLKAACATIKDGPPVYPYVFPVRRPERRPKELALRAGYYCFDTFTPLDVKAYNAARSAVDVAMTAAEELLSGRRIVYALCRPPGHHAERRLFGGFCYFSNAALAANRLSKEGRVAILDIDFHHGNGQQDIFYTRRDVLTLSIHGHPNYAYPYFSGFADEIGEGDGRGFNRNFPLPEDADETRYMEAFSRALGMIQDFKPSFLVLCLGFDILRGDPTGSFLLGPDVMATIGKRLASMYLPILIVQEGGYTLRNLRRGITRLFTGITQGLSAREITS
ncbi:MAG TPA: histone deacetylase family protein [Thermoanaerobaculia bacterium]|nr:histone deacetylase family protein [Thermoanaerobaculia bacterium]HUM29771.1 histone deacetylase family protein [Thermoanaerobaculia bacterium]HXK67071.1 histone deacetylase family protein [Thermoanaerobaculia bacterium]